MMTEFNANGAIGNLMKRQVKDICHSVRTNIRKI